MTSQVETEVQIPEEFVISIPEEIQDKLKKWCKFQGKPLREVVEREIGLRFGMRLPKEEVFFPKRTFGIPRDSFVLFALPRHEWRKLSDWLQEKKRVKIWVGSSSEVILVNQDILEK